MGRALYESQPVFRQTLEWCANTLAELGFEKPLLELLYGSEAAFIDETAYSQPAVFSIGLSLAELWKAEGVQPAAVMGHSVGEFVAAVVAGVMSPRDGLRLIVARATLMQAAPKGDGVMVAVRASEEQARAAIQTVLGSELNDQDCPCGCLQSDIFLVGTTEEKPSPQQKGTQRRDGSKGSQEVCVIGAVNGPRSIGMHTMSRFLNAFSPHTDIHSRPPPPPSSPTTNMLHLTLYPQCCRGHRPACRPSSTSWASRVAR